MDFTSLIERKLVTAKRYENGLTVYKYSRKVFYEALWNEDPLLLEARGLVMDDDGNIVIWPFTKVFNHHENGTECEPGRMVNYVRKVNGFMSAARFYKGEWLISTTGSLDSDFAAMAHKHIMKLGWSELPDPRLVFLFEIVDETDPHIVQEDVGAWLIGVRVIRPGSPQHGLMACEYQLDDIAEEIGAKRPEWKQDTFENCLAELQTVEHEGFMVRDAWTEETIMKLKSPHYLTKKFLMRMGKNKAKEMFQDPVGFKMKLDEEFYSVFDRIIGSYTEQGWTELSDQERRAVIEDIIKEV
ncbi:RNA ligase [compost metagenome]